MADVLNSAMSFFLFPAEVRNCIYSFVFANLRTKFLPHLQKHGLSVAGGITLLLASRRVHDEANPIFLSTAQLDLTRLVDPTTSALDPILDITYLRSVKAHFSVLSPFLASSTLMNALTHTTSFTLTGFAPYCFVVSDFTWDDDGENDDKTNEDFARYAALSILNEDGIAMIEASPWQMIGLDAVNGQHKGTGEFEIKQLYRDGRYQLSHVRLFSETQILCEVDQSFIHSYATLDHGRAVVEVRNAQDEERTVAFRLESFYPGVLLGVASVIN